MDRIRINENMPFPPAGTRQAGGDRGFGHRLKTAVEEVNQQQLSADSAMEKVVKGSMGIHEAMIAASKADISLRLLLQIRNKVLDAYREISRMGF